MRATETATFNITTPFGVIYSAWYDHYMAPGVFKVLQTELHGRFLERVGPGSHVLDVSCGGGQHAVHMASRRPDLHVTGVDLSPELVRRARRLAAKAEIGWSSSKATHSTWPSETRTSITCTPRVPSSTGRISDGASRSVFGCCGPAVASW